MSYLILDTLQKLKGEGYRLWASCMDCNHSADLDLDVLIERFGPEFQFVDRRDELDASLRCSKCGRKRIEVRMSPNDTGGLAGKGSRR